MTTRSDAYDRRQREAGWKRVMVRLSPEQVAQLNRLSRTYGGQEAALRKAVRLLYDCVDIHA